MILPIRLDRIVSGDCVFNDITSPLRNFIKVVDKLFEGKVSATIRDIFYKGKREVKLISDASDRAVRRVSDESCESVKKIKNIISSLTSPDVGSHVGDTGSNFFDNVGSFISNPFGRRKRLQAPSSEKEEPLFIQNSNRSTSQYFKNRKNKAE